MMTASTKRKIGDNIRVCTGLPLYWSKYGSIPHLEAFSLTFSFRFWILSTAYLYYQSRHLIKNLQSILLSARSFDFSASLMGLLFAPFDQLSINFCGKL